MKNGLHPKSCRAMKTILNTAIIDRNLFKNDSTTCIKWKRDNPANSFIFNYLQLITDFKYLQFIKLYKKNLFVKWLFFSHSQLIHKEIIWLTHWLQRYLLPDQIIRHIVWSALVTASYVLSVLSSVFIG